VEEIIIDTSIWDGDEGSGTSLCEILAHKLFEEFEIYTGFENQRIESCDSGNH